jgi:hypothetical protein
MSTRSAWLLGLWMWGGSLTVLAAEESPPAPAKPAVRVGFKPAASRTLGLADGEAERRLEVDRKLSQLVSIDLQAVPLREAIERVLKSVDVLPVFEEASLTEDKAIKLDEPVTLKLADTPAKLMLREICRPRSVLTVTGDSHVLVLSNNDRDQQQRTVVFDVTDLVSRPDGTGNSDDLAALITQSVQPNDWVEFGGSNSLAVHVSHRAVLLMVRADAETAEALQVLLGELRRNGAGIDPPETLIEWTPTPQTRTTLKGKAGLDPARGSGFFAGDPLPVPDTEQKNSKPSATQSVHPNALSFPESGSLGGQAILDRLSRTITIGLKDVMLHSAISMVLESAEVDTLFDEIAMRDDNSFGELDQPVSLQADNESIRSVLNRVLRAHRLRWVVRSGAVVITVDSLSESPPETRTYNVTDFLVTPEGVARTRPFIDAIQSVIHPDDWQDVGGANSIRMLVRPRAVSMTVRADSATHLELSDLLKALRDMGAANPPTGPITLPPPGESNGRWEPGFGIHGCLSGTPSPNPAPPVKTNK